MNAGRTEPNCAELAHLKLPCQHGLVRFGCVVPVKTKTMSTSMLGTSPRFPQTVLVPARSTHGQLAPRRCLYLACAPRVTPTKNRLAHFVRTSCEQGLARFISPGWFGSVRLSLELCSCEWGISHVTFTKYCFLWLIAKVVISNFHYLIFYYY